MNKNSFLNIHPEVIKSPNLFEITRLARRRLDILLADSSNQERVILKSINNQKQLKHNCIYFDLSTKRVQEIFIFPSELISNEWYCD